MQLVSPVPSQSLTRPSDQTIAFAASIVRSKPGELNIDEYLQLLRQHIAPGARKAALSSTHRHLDRAAFWRSEYERICGALSAAQDEVVSLRRSLDAAKSRPEHSSRPSTATRKRKQDPDVIPYPRSPRKARRDGPLEELFATDSDSTALGFNFAGEIGNILLRSLYQMHALLRSREEFTAADLAYHIVRAASALTQVVKQRLMDAMVQDEGLEESMSKTITAARRSLASMMSAYIKLSRLPDREEALGKVVHAIVSMFQALVSILEDLATAELPQASVAEEHGQNSLAHGLKSRPKSSRAIKPKNNLPLVLTTRFLAGVVDLLDSTSSSNKALFEGLAFVVLEKIGETLFVNTFGHRRGATLEVEMLQSVVCMESTSAEQDPQERTLLQQKADLLSPYLTHLLKRIISAAPGFLGFLASNRSGKHRPTTPRASTKVNLAIAAKERLQRTLVNCVFGMEGVDQHDPFRDCLKMPQTGNGRVVMPKVKDVEVKEWFREEVWRLLGWEILSHEDEW